ncbi:MAG: carboxypeptidase-like regulatory domain-containing protein [Terriglobia bacterium]
MTKNLAYALLLATTWLLLCRPAMAQSTFATITGVVTDPVGAMLPGAKVEAINTTKNYPYTAVSNSDGYYTLPDLEEGPYTIHVTAPGFEEFVVHGIELRARDIRRIDVKMQLQAVHTAVQVTTGATLINTETSQISDVKDTELLRFMPATYLRVWDYLQIAPMVYKPLGAFTTVRMAGSMHNEGEYSMDGITAQDGTGNPLLQRTMDNVEEGMQEMRVDEAGNSAEYEGLGQLSVESKSGTNTLHGSAYDVYSTPGLQAIDQFTGVPSGESRVKHKVGVSLGGPAGHVL